MNFDLSWFKTVPGLLITCGTFLLFLEVTINIIKAIINKTTPQVISKPGTVLNQLIRVYSSHDETIDEV